MKSCRTPTSAIEDPNIQTNERTRLTASNGLNRSRSISDVGKMWARGLSEAKKKPRDPSVYKGLRGFDAGGDGGI